VSELMYDAHALDSDAVARSIALGMRVFRSLLHRCSPSSLTHRCYVPYSAVVLVCTNS
jgi:hypothetical protein